MLSILLAVPSCFNSFWHGVIPTSSAKPSEVITQLSIIMLVILSSGSAAFFIYFFDQTTRAVHAAAVVVDGCQEMLTEREYAISELIANQKMDMIRMECLEKIIKEKENIKGNEETK